MTPTAIAQDWGKVDLAIERVSAFTEMDQYLEQAPKVLEKREELAQQLAVESPERATHLQHNIRAVNALRSQLAQAFQGVPERVQELRREYRRLRWQAFKQRWTDGWRWVLDTGKAVLLAPFRFVLWIGHKLRSPFRASSQNPLDDREPPTRRGVGE